MHGIKSMTLISKIGFICKTEQAWVRLRGQSRARCMIEASVRITFKKQQILIPFSTYTLFLLISPLKNGLICD